MTENNPEIPFEPLSPKEIEESEGRKEAKFLNAQKDGLLPSVEDTLDELQFLAERKLPETPYRSRAVKEQTQPKTRRATSRGKAHDQELLDRQSEKGKADLRRLAAIELAIKKNKQLTVEDLRFLYEVDDHIQTQSDDSGSGRERVESSIENEKALDARIARLIKNRDIKVDISLALDIPQDKISTTPQEALRGGMLFHYGNLDLHELPSAHDIVLPEHVSGSLYINNLTSTEGITFPRRIGDSLVMTSLRSASNVQLPEHVGGSVFLFELKTAENVTFPMYVGANCDLSRLEVCKDCVLPNEVGYLLNLRKLVSVERTTFPKFVNELKLSNLESAQDLVLSDRVSRLKLGSLISAEGITLPRQVDDLDLSSLQSPKGLALPVRMKGDVDLGRLDSADNLIFSERMGTLSLGKAKSAKNILLPEEVDSLNLGSLTSVDEKIVFPKLVRGDFYLFEAASATGATLPERIEGSCFLNNLSSLKGVVLPRYVGEMLNLSSVTTIDGLTFPEHIGGFILFERLSLDDLAVLKRKYPQLALKFITNPDDKKANEWYRKKHSQDDNENDEE
ncbi:MAG: hypothetical protein WC734_03520 [Patescibacteria group bacterium]|jgi:hypothetical protein